MRILLVEDDVKIAENIKKYFEENYMVVKSVTSLETAEIEIENENYDTLILDLVLPDGNGLDLCQKIRNKKNDIPIIVISAKNHLKEKVEGIDAGADDYLTKPFYLRELLSRVKALIRRKYCIGLSPLVIVNNLSLNINSCQAYLDGQKLSLSPKEYSLLEYLMLNQNRVVDRQELMDHVWGDSINGFSNTVDVHIRYLRKKIERDPNIKIIKTIKDKGYMITSE